MPTGEFYSFNLKDKYVHFQTYVLAPRHYGQTGAGLIMLHIIEVILIDHCNLGSSHLRK